MSKISSRTLKLQQNLTGGDPFGSLQDFHKFKQTTTFLCQKINLSKREQKLNPSAPTKKIEDGA